MLRSFAMMRSLRFAAVLVAALALVTWLGTAIARNTTRAWFERDLASRAKLAASGAQPALLANWGTAHAREIERVLHEMARDEHVMGVALCSANLGFIARTPDYSDRFGCAELARRVNPA